MPADTKDIEAVFRSQIGRGLHFGAQLAVLRGDEVLVDLYGGSRDSRGRLPVGPDTPFMVYSATKPFVAMCVHKLAEDGKLGLDDPVAAYWPGFAKHGKDKITTRHLLLHQAGIPLSGAGVAEIVPWLLPAWSARRVEAIRPESAPGERCDYHMFSAGLALGELIRLTDGRSAARYLTEEFLLPLGMTDSHAGLPPRAYGKASRIHTADPEQKAAALVFSNRLYRSIFMPAASLNSTARDMARFYRMLAAGGTAGGRRFLAPGTIAEATALRYEGPDGSSDRRIRWSEGFVLGGIPAFPDSDMRTMGRGGSVRTFGHGGQGGCALAWADPDSGVTFAFTCNRFRELRAVVERFDELANAVWDAVGRG